MKKYITFSILIVLITLFIGCGQKSTSNTSSPEELAAGFQLLETNCFACHSPKGTMDARVAPPMIAIKKHYIDGNTTKATFTKDLIAFIDHLSEDISKMPGARRKFGLMPQMSLTNEQLTQIAAYLYETEIEAPDWFEEHYQQERKLHMKHSKTGKTPLQLGEEIAMATKVVLGKNLLGAIKFKGTAGAVDFCNTKAIYLTDSMGIVKNAKVSRLSDQPRNPDNLASEPFLSQVATYKTQLANGVQLQANTIIHEGKSYHCIPIVTNKMCLQCHGKKGTDIDPATLKTIAEKYLNDQATGYTENQIRGIWVVDMN
jgi:cytochrome c553